MDLHFYKNDIAFPKVLIGKLNELSELSTTIDDDIASSKTTYSSEKIEELIGSFSDFNVEVVDELPAIGNPHTIYFVPSESGGQQYVVGGLYTMDDQNTFSGIVGKTDDLQIGDVIKVTNINDSSIIYIESLDEESIKINMEGSSGPVIENIIDSSQLTQQDSLYRIVDSYIVLPELIKPGIYYIYGYTLKFLVYEDITETEPTVIPTYEYEKLPSTVFYMNYNYESSDKLCVTMYEDNGTYYIDEQLLVNYGVFVTYNKGDIIKVTEENTIPYCYATSINSEAFNVDNEITGINSSEVWEKDHYYKITNIYKKKLILNGLELFDYDGITYEEVSEPNNYIELPFLPAFSIYLPILNNYKDEYMWINEKWELIGNTLIDLSNYYTKDEVNSQLSNKLDKLYAGDNISIQSSTVSAIGYTYNKTKNSFAEGPATIASGSYSHAEGTSDATNSYSHAEGFQTSASGYSAHSEGESTIATGRASHTEGSDTQAQNKGEHAEGCYNKSNKSSDTYGNAGNTQHSIGIGTENRMNAVEVMQNGDVYILGIGSYDGTNPSSADHVKTVCDKKVESASIKNIWSGTQLQYDNLQTYSNDTLYIIQ